MPTPTYDLLASSVLTSSASSVTFSSIDQGYRDLILVCVSTVTYNGGSTEIKFNGSTTGYNVVYMSGNGSATQSGALSNQGSITPQFQFSPYTANEPLQTTIQIMDYSATDKHKSVLIRQGPASKGVSATAARWADTSAVNSITFSTTDMIAGSSFHLYGISA